ncbi:hypothetical protein [Ferrovum sp.]|uniref:hypothetical protein n=1 Tax=Ferrovum sp. TaxID=2609467 RepID=UPI00260AC00C|nr:hypothetical protein [Ferrovum sp.]
MILVATTVASVAGCANVAETFKPDQSYLQNRTANQLGYEASQVKISGMHTDNDNMKKWLGKTEKVFQSESAGLIAERYACYASTTLGEHNAKTLSDQNHNSRRRPP